MFLSSARGRGGEKVGTMAYRDDLLSRLRASGKWAQLSPHAQAFIENMTDAEACEALVSGSLFEVHGSETIASVGLFCMDQIQEPKRKLLTLRECR
jgi:hypothetical protein